MTKKQYAGKGIVELLEFAKNDWATARTLEINEQYTEWKDAALDAARNSHLGDLLKARDILDTLEDVYVDCAVTEAIEEYICGSLQERVTLLEKSMTVLLKQHEDDTADISVGQLNRLKGGYTP